MAKMTNKNPNPLIVIVLLFLSNPLSVTSSISETELDAAIAALRSRGYHLFGNSITTSDVRLSLLLSKPNASYTLFAPTDAALFSLDMTSTASNYVTALRFHVAIGLYSHPQLRSLPHRSSLRTLVPSRNILISHRTSSENSDLVTVDGVDVGQPDVYYGQYLVVHGLNGILPLHRKPFSAPVRSPKSGVPPPTSKKSGISPSTSTDSSHPPSISTRSAFSPSMAPDASHPPSISPRSVFSPTIAPHPSHSPSKTRSSGESPLVKQSSSASPSSSPSISQEPGFSPSTAPEFGSANPPDLRSPVISPSIGAPIKGRMLFSEESENSAGIPPAMGFPWRNCDIGGHGRVSCQLVQDGTL